MKVGEIFEFKNGDTVTITKVINSSIDNMIYFKNQDNIIDRCFQSDFIKNVIK